MSDLRSRRQLPCGLVHACALIAVLVLSTENSIIRSSEAKEFDWSDLGVSLAGGSKSANSPAGNLRIVVSPQRRSTKNFEFEYTNGSQPAPTNQGDSGYVVSSSGSPYLAQSIYQLSPNHSVGHSSAYSALSASLASLKSRLNARGVTLTSTLADATNQPSSHLYTSNNNAYSSSVLIDPSQQQQSSQQQQQQQQQVQTQAQQSSQPTYLSVSSQQDSQAASPYTASPSQGSENKTIVLAIPAKINFLTGSKQTASQQHQQSASQSGQQAPQLSVLQSSGILNAQEGSMDQVGQVAGTDPQEHQQYVIVNQPQGFNDHHSHSVAASLSPTPVGSSGQVYSTIYQPQAISQSGGFSMKYLPTYSQAATQVQQPAVQKVYSVIDSSQLQQQVQPQPMPAQQVAPVISTAYETQVVDQPISGTRYISCIDTCNSADPRWRKYTVSRYKACCSRSSQFDSSFEQPSAEKVSDMSTRYSDDAYYSYLQRRSRSRRPRRQRARQYASRHSPSSSAPASHQDDEAADSGTSLDSASRPSSGRSYHEPKYYRSRGYGSSSSSADLTSADVGSPVSQSSKYATKEARASRRGRSRDFESASDSAHQADDSAEEGSVYPRESSSWTGSSSSSALASPSGYGSGDYSVDLQGRGYGSERGSSEDDEQTRYDEPAEMEQSSSGKAETQEYPHDSASETNDESEQDPATGPAYKYPSSGYRKKSSKPRRKPAQNKEQPQPKAYSYKKLNAKKSKSKPDGHSSNGTDYDSAQPGDYYQDSTSSNSSQDQEDHGSPSASSYPAKDSGSNYESSETEKDSAAKYRNNLNDTAVAHLSKTTMHLKEILSILERKAQSSRGNDSFFSSSQPQQPSQQQQPQQQPAQLPATSTAPPPITTTTLSYPLSLLGSGSPYSSPMSSDFLNQDLSSYKSPYKFDHSSFSAGSLGSPPLAMPPSFGSYGSEAMGPLTPPYPSPYSLHTGKPMSNLNGPHQRKRRVNKNARYNELMLQKAAHGLGTPSSLMHPKNRFLSPSYYPALQYPYLYRGASQTLTNPYPYKSHHKNPYSSLLSSSMSSKLAAAANSGGLYTDESRLHGLAGLDPLASMASSLRPSAAMRLRSKPFIFQPQVLPIYTRHSILTQPLDGRA